MRSLPGATHLTPDLLGMGRAGEAARAFQEGLCFLEPFYQALSQAFGGLYNALHQP